MNNPNSLAGIEYHGHPGNTASCRRALESLLHYGVNLERALVLTVRDQLHGTHALLLKDSVGYEIAIKSGFTSGYGGEGPHGFSHALTLLHRHGVHIDEIEVEQNLLEKLDVSALSLADIEQLWAIKPSNPQRYWDYIKPDEEVGPSDGNPWRKRPAIIPMAIVDDRLMGIALSFWNDPDMALLKAHRHLEIIVQKRAGIETEAAAKLGPAKLYGSAFNGDDAPLSWDGITAGERQGRVNLFIGNVSAFRNVRAHREQENCSHQQLTEFLLLNQLYKLESEAVSEVDSENEDWFSSQVDNLI